MGRAPLQQGVAWGRKQGLEWSLYLALAVGLVSCGPGSAAEPSPSASESTEPESTESQPEESQPEAKEAEVPEPETPEPVTLQRGTPLDEVVVPSPEEDTETRTEGAIGDVAKGLAGKDLSGMGVIDDSKTVKTADGVIPVSWGDLSMQDIEMEDILDSLLYPEEYEPGEFEFPDRIKRNDDEVVSIVGYMIPLEWKETTVPEFMLVRDLMGCCFGGSPQPDEWINVKMVREGAEYYPYIPVVVTGTFRIEGIEDEAGYAAGCFHMEATSVSKEP